MKNKFILLVAVLALPLCMWANNVQCSITNYNSANNTLSVSIAWENSWRIADFNDGVLLFIKYKDDVNPIWRTAPVLLSLGSLSPVGNEGDLNYQYKSVAYNGATSASYKSVLISRAAGNNGNGTVSGTANFSLDLLNAVNPSFKVFAIEMVYVPSGAFYIGDGLSPTYTNGSTADPFYVASEAAITIGTGIGNLNINIPNSNPTFLSASENFPKGTNPFWIMKYELSQEIYAEYLNCLPRNEQDAAVFSSVNLNAGATTVANYFVMTNQATTPSYKQGIRCLPTITPTEPVTFFCDLDNDGSSTGTADGQNIGVRAPSAAVAFKFLDWAGLRPMTGYEYQKACRGTLTPVPGELAWGSATNYTPTVSNAGAADESYTPVSDGPFVGNTAVRNGAFATSTSTRKQSGGSFYGVMELSSSLPEMHLGYYETNGSAITTDQLGDGNSANGLPTSWPPYVNIQQTNTAANARVSALTGSVAITTNTACAIRGVIQ